MMKVFLCLFVLKGGTLKYLLLHVHPVLARFVQAEGYEEGLGITVYKLNVMIMKPHKHLYCTFLLAFFTLTVHRPEQILKCVGTTDQYECSC